MQTQGNRKLDSRIMPNYPNYQGSTWKNICCLFYSSPHCFLVAAPRTQARKLNRTRSLNHNCAHQRRYGPGIT